MPADLKDRVSVDFLKRNVCAPLEREDGTVRVAVEDPYDLTRLDAIKAMNLAPRYEFVVGLREDILAWVRATYGESGPMVEEADLGRIIMDLGTGEEDEVEGAEEEEEPEVDETDSGVVRLANQIIIDAYKRGRLRHPRRALRQALPHRGSPPGRRRVREYTEVPATTATPSSRA